MIKLLLCGVAMLSATTAMSEDYPSLVFELTDGSNLSVPSEGLSMVFNDSELLATTSGGLMEIPVDKLSKIYFSQEVSGVNATAVGREGVEVFSTTGMSVGSFNSESEARAFLPSGFYIMQSQQKTYKTVIK